ncbi:mersacidin/lichenicidin family type 2 lantibiotic [Alicyclobacillus acidiphilus]|uniref:mersacidin/lichenicidin family type 2 lantibiotic n=1 Tax=Alicyclobacillus acidiphilus TaxID=182455 RepID=UPI0008370612|nr:mersacidin/lichenicidin family type 2 lantibiotic [Alicyclobacillus acidiphilus]
MTNEQIVKAWKDPEFRSTLENVPYHPAGDIAAMNAIHGDVQPETTPTTITVSSEPCGFTIGTVIITLTDGCF